MCVFVYVSFVHSYNKHCKIVANVLRKHFATCCYWKTITLMVVIVTPLNIRPLHTTLSVVSFV